jgi:hypothetical protein
MPAPTRRRAWIDRLAPGQFRQLIAAKWAYPSKRIGRPGIMKTVRELIVRMATDNSSWGYARIQGELKELNHRVARSTIAKTLKEHGIPPSTKGFR